MLSLDVLGEIWDVIESVSEGFLTYSRIEFCFIYSRHFMARTVMARLPWLSRTRFLRLLEKSQSC